MKDSIGTFITKIIIAFILIFIGIYTYGSAEDKPYSSYYSSRPDTETKSSYGGDAYTGIQNAGAQAATNSYYIYKRVDTFTEKALQTAGILIIIFGSEKLLITIFENTRKRESKSKEK